jgi:hypothetical protein
MDFLLYLSPQGMEIYNMISKKIRVVENAPICRKHDIFGWYDNRSKTIIFCTDRILSKPNPHYNFNMVLFHESVHVAQACKQNMREIKALGISPSIMSLSENLEKDLKISVKNFGSSIVNMEREAFWMETKPDKVRYVVQKYCF